MLDILGYIIGFYVVLTELYDKVNILNSITSHCCGVCDSLDHTLVDTSMD